MIERRASAAVCRIGGAHPRRPLRPRAASGRGAAAPPPPSRRWPVLMTNTSSSVGWCRSIAAWRSSASSSARTTARCPRPPRPGGRRRRRACRRPPARTATSTAAASADPLGVGRGDHQRGVADAGLQFGRGAFGDDLAAVDDPDAPGQLVRLLQVLGGQEHRRPGLAVQAADLLPQCDARRRVEAGRGLVQKQHDRLVNERQGQVEATAHAARVGADAPVGGVGRARPGRAARRPARAPSCRGIACRVACRRSSSRPVMNGSIAASWRATPIERRTLAASVTTSNPATAGGPAGRAQQRGQHPDGRALAGAVGPRKP